MPFKRLQLAACTFLIFIAGVAHERAAAQTYAQQFDALFLKERPDSVQIHTLIRLWQRTNPEDPQLYVAAFNYYFTQSRQDTAPGSALSRRDSGQVGAESSYYDPRRVHAAMDWINAGIARFPDRLDMRFGKAHALRLNNQFDSLVIVLQQTIGRSVENKNQWQWTRGESLDSGRKLLLTTLQTYLRELYETDRVTLLPVISRLGESIIGVYPEEVEILTTTAVSLVQLKQYDLAVSYLRRALNLRSQDIVVLNNLAEAYRLKGDKTASKRYLEQIEKYGDADQKKAARKRMKSLRRE